LFEGVAVSVVSRQREARDGDANIVNDVCADGNDGNERLCDNVAPSRTAVVTVAVAVFSSSNRWSSFDSVPGAPKRIIDMFIVVGDGHPLLVTVYLFSCNCFVNSIQTTTTKPTGEQNRQLQTTTHDVKKKEKKTRGTVVVTNAHVNNLINSGRPNAINDSTR
jgi:hypothetical protein